MAHLLKITYITYVTTRFQADRAMKSLHKEFEDLRVEMVRLVDATEKSETAGAARYDMLAASNTRLQSQLRVFEASQESADVELLKVSRCNKASEEEAAALRASNKLLEDALAEKEALVVKLETEADCAPNASGAGANGCINDGGSPISRHRTEADTVPASPHGKGLTQEDLCGSNSTGTSTSHQSKVGMTVAGVNDARAFPNTAAGSSTAALDRSRSDDVVQALEQELG